MSEKLSERRYSSLNILHWCFNSELKSNHCRYGTLATGCGDRRVDIWDIRVRKRIFQVLSHFRRVFGNMKLCFRLVSIRKSTGSVQVYHIDELEKSE